MRDSKEVYGEDEDFEYIRNLNPFPTYYAHIQLLEDRKSIIMEGEWKSKMQTIQRLDKDIKFWRDIIEMVKAK